MRVACLTCAEALGSSTATMWLRPATAAARQPSRANVLWADDEVCRASLDLVSAFSTVLANAKLQWGQTFENRDGVLQEEEGGGGGVSRVLVIGRLGEASTF